MQKLMNSIFVAVFAWGSLASAIQAEEKASPAPEGYKLVYNQPFESGEAIANFVFSDPAAWNLEKAGDHLALGLVAQSKYKPAHRSPLNIALVNGPHVGDFVLEVQMQQTGKEYGHRDMCLYFGFQDPDHFYYVHIATKTDAHAHNIFIVNDAPRLKISDKTTEGFDWGKPGTWHTVRLLREASSGKIEVYVDKGEEPIMTATDKTFGAGWLGFGSFDDTGLVDDIRLWSPEVSEKGGALLQAGGGEGIIAKAYVQPIAGTDYAWKKLFRRKTLAGRR